MPSASAKIEKVAPVEATDPVKQIVVMLEKRIRNLEKRKIKLDNYRGDVKNGKELNEDQRSAVDKYDQVIGVLEFTREFSKTINGIILESARQQKKMAKKEQLERQQREIQRLQEAFVYRHIVSSFQAEEVRNDFLSGENGAVQLTGEQMSQLDALSKLMEPELPSEKADLSNHFHVLADNHIFLVEGKNKEVAGTTYKVLKDLVHRIKECGYFSRPSQVPDEVSAEEESVAEETVPVEEPVPEASEPDEPDVEKVEQNGPLQEVLSSQGSFNFLQESQIDLDAPHMDPAVVAVHQMAPPTANFAAYPKEAEEDAPPVVSPPVARHTAPLDFDPTHPIPTQTFTNQSFAMMTFVPPTFPDTPALDAPEDSQPEQTENQQPKETESAEEESNHLNEKNGTNEGYTPPYRGGFRGRGRGRGNFYRGRSNFNNGRGGYHYYQDRNGYNGNFRRGNNRGPRGSAPSRGRGNNYRAQQTQ